jgi:hypothetical protein
MQETLDIKLTGNEASRIAAAIDKCDESLREIFRRMKKDQAAIEKLGVQTRKILAELKTI